MIFTGVFMTWSLFMPVARLGEKKSLLTLTALRTYEPPPLSPEVKAMHEKGEYVLSLETGQSQEDDSYLCVAVPVSKGVSSVYEYIPDADKDIVHHMMLFGCQGVSEEAESGVFACKPHFGVCSIGYPDVMYAWANGASPLHLGSGKPGSTAGAGYFIGDLVDIKYMVLQVHTLKARQESTAKLTVRTSRTLPDEQMSVMLFGNMEFNLEPKKPSVDVPVTCCVRGSGPMEIFGYRVHAHQHGRNVSLAVDGQRLLMGDTQLPHVFATPETRLSIPFGKVRAGTLSFCLFSYALIWVMVPYRFPLFTCPCQHATLSAVFLCFQRSCPRACISLSQVLTNRYIHTYGKSPLEVFECVSHMS